MTTSTLAATATGAIPPRAISVLMCEPRYFEVSYAINPWMDPSTGASSELAVEQWRTLVDVYRTLGFDVDLIEPIPGLPDMVYAANGAFTLDGIAYGASFTHPQRQPESAAYLRRLEELGFDCREPHFVNEGEGDILVVDDVLLAGHGFRTDPRAHQELRDIFGREVVSLRLVDPRYYHLDTAMSVVAHSVAFLPDAFDGPSQAEIRRRFPDAIEVGADEAGVLGLNSFGDGSSIVLTDRAPRFAAALEAAGHTVVGVALPELLKGGGSVKCCTLELRR
ncbi:dimethylargininase [Aestuariimicrobium kwangyangense]|uniref:dimethylargininase n=1 Tax=Aestuariimicrobium kwangyangense TaxID=396389 RepID=UPI000414A842|nr:dimethylargininase [Aestuariimicrobium kwangyangense]